MENKQRRSRKSIYAIKSVLNPYRIKNFDSLFLTWSNENHPIAGNAKIFLFCEDESNKDFLRKGFYQKRFYQKGFYKNNDN